MSEIEKNFVTLLFVTLLIASFASIASAGRVPSPGMPLLTPTPLTEQDKLLEDISLRFVANVFRLNISSYYIEGVIVEGPGPNYDKSVYFKFRSAESKVDVDCLIRNNSVFWCTIYPVQGSPAFTTPKASDVLTVAKDTLNSLQAFSAKDYLPTLRSMLDAVTELESSKTTVGDFTQEITVSGNVVRVFWEPFANGLSNPQNKLTLEFKDGNLMFFCDYLDMFKIGSAEVKISEQEAIQIAIEHARAYSWQVGNETVSNVNVLGSPIIANISLQNRGNNTLYPYWDIWLPLDKMYSGGVTAFHVGIWADTGEVAFISPIGYYGDPNTASSPHPTNQQPATQSNPANPTQPTSSQPVLDLGLAIAIALIAGSAVIIGYLFRKHKR
ncbi:MAG: hypothetical protein WHU54_03080 [Candidatus Bathyarchaeia archaeon]